MRRRARPLQRCTCHQSLACRGWHRSACSRRLVAARRKRQPLRCTMRRGSRRRQRKHLQPSTCRSRRRSQSDKRLRHCCLCMPKNHRCRSRKDCRACRRRPTRTRAHQLQRYTFRSARVLRGTHRWPPQRRWPKAMYRCSSRYCTTCRRCSLHRRRSFLSQCICPQRCTGQNDIRYLLCQMCSLTNPGCQIRTCCHACRKHPMRR